jgi:hypothetical protein
MFTNSGSDDVLDELKHTPPPTPSCHGKSTLSTISGIELKFSDGGEEARLIHPRKRSTFICLKLKFRNYLNPE